MTRSSAPGRWEQHATWVRGGQKKGPGQVLASGKIEPRGGSILQYRPRLKTSTRGPSLVGPKPPWPYKFIFFFVVSTVLAILVCSAGSNRRPGGGGREGS